MKAIELTEQHKSKLLEMCKVLFPDYMVFEIDNDGYLLFVDNKCSAIHWFEFVHTYLMYKLSYEFSKIPNVQGRPIHIELWELNKGSHFTIHPIDYLYEKFLKLKTIP
jgi:hypothetical protein